MAQALKVSEHLNAVAPADVKGLLLTLELRLQLHAKPAELIAWADQLRHAHPDDPRFELVLAGVNLRLAQWSPSPEDLAATGGEPPSAAARDAWAAEGRKWLQVAAGRTPPDADFVRSFVRTLDLNGMFPQSLALLLNAATTIHDPGLRRMLVSRLWYDGYIADVIEQTASLDRAKPLTDPTLLAYRAAALYESGKRGGTAGPTTGPAATQPAPPGAVAEADAIAAALRDRKSDAVAQGWAQVLAARFSESGKTPRELIAQMQAALGADPENAVAWLIEGDLYAALGETDAAANAWEESSRRAAEWGVPNARLARARLAQGRSGDALGYACAAFFRSPHLHDVRAVALRAWFAVVKEEPKEKVRPGEWDDLLNQAQDVQQQWPGDPETVAVYTELLVHAGRRDAAIAAARAALTSEPPPPPETVAALAAINVSRKLGLDAEVARLTSSDAATLSPDVAFRRALTLLGGGDAAAGLSSLKSSRDRANGAPISDGPRRSPRTSTSRTTPQRSRHGSSSAVPTLIIWRFRRRRRRPSAGRSIARSGPAPSSGCASSPGMRGTFGASSVAAGCWRKNCPRAAAPRHGGRSTRAAPRRLRSSPTFPGSRRMMPRRIGCSAWRWTAMGSGPCAIEELTLSATLRPNDPQSGVELREPCMPRGATTPRGPSSKSSSPQTI